MSDFSDSENLGPHDGAEERQKIKEKLSTMSFEDLQKLKDEMGTKLYNKTIFGDRETRAEGVKASFKRANKNRPREMSSKKHIKVEFSSVKKHVARDPRFEPMCGSFDRKMFKNNYKFVNELRKKEKKQLEKQMKNTTDKEEKKKIQFVVQRLDNQIREEEVRGHKEHHEYEEKKEAKLHMEQGDKPHYKKRSVKKLESLISKFEELKKTNKIQKHIERRTKKMSAKERRNLRREKLITDD